MYSENESKKKLTLKFNIMKATNLHQLSKELRASIKKGNTAIFYFGYNNEISEEAEEQQNIKRKR